jgi:beta-glucosidase/6-phospho-beta-glucosidase/beta-galactosidase
VPRLLLSVVLLLVLAAPARAATPEIGIADDRVLIPGGPLADRAVAEWSALGVDTVRIFAHWGRIAPPRKPAGFRPSDPGDPRYQWFYLDNAVERVRNAGMSVTLTVTGPGPPWTSRNPRRRQGQWKPRPAAFAAFSAAVAKRYGSRVDRYILWNEPNIWVWLSPQVITTSRRGS